LALSDASCTIVEAGEAVGAHAAQFAVEIGLARVEPRDGLGDRWIFVRPVEPAARQQLDGAAVEPRMHAVAVIFDFVQPAVAVRRRVDQLRELRRDPLRQTGRRRGTRYHPRHAGGRKKLLRRSKRILEMVDLADMLRRMGEFEADALAMAAGRETPALDHRDLVRHVGVRRIMRNRVDAGLRDDSPGLNSCAMAALRCKLIHDL
jgi:hypothetical protein